MGESAEPTPPPREPAGKAPGWLTFVTQYAAPAVVASLIGAAVSVYTAVGTAQEKQREYNTKFQELVSAVSIRTAFGGQYVDDSDPKKTAHLRSRESFEQSVREQQASATLLSLQSVADSETQRRTVLLIGARLLNADPGYTSTGGPAARLLTVLIDEADRGRQSWNPWERNRNVSLWNTINAQSFRDLVTAGYSSDYYNDDFTTAALLPYSPTLNGDAPITTDPKFQILHKLTPDEFDGWVHLATFGYKFPRGVTPRSAPGSPRGSSQPVLTRKVAADFLDEVVDVTLRHNAANVGLVTAQYAIADPRASPPPPDLRFRAADVIDPNLFPKKLIMLKHRLLRNRPPVQYINPDGKFRKGSLGKILGAVPAGSCITVEEPMHPVLVFIPAQVLAAPPPAPSPAPSSSPEPSSAPRTSPAPQTSPAPVPVPAPAANGSQSFGGLVHMWAHVHGTTTGEDCLSTVSAPPR